MKLLFKPWRFVFFICFTSIWLGFSIELSTSNMLSGKNLHYSGWDILGWIPSRGSEGSMIACCSLSLSLLLDEERWHAFGLFSVCDSCSEPHCMGHCAWALWTMKKKLHGEDCLIFYMPFHNIRAYDCLVTCFSCLCRDEFICQMFDLNAKIRLVSLTWTYVALTGNLCIPCMIYNCTLLWLVSWFWRCFLHGRWIAVWMHMIC